MQSKEIIKGISSMCSKFFAREFVTLCLLVTILCNCGSDAKHRKRLTLKTCGTRNERFIRIVGGNFVRPGDYPWMVTLYENKTGFIHACGGVILNEHWVITAAHCIDFPDEPHRYAIYTGLDLLSVKNQWKTSRHKVSKLIVHEDYDNYTNLNDIALMKTWEAIDFKSSRGLVNGICLPTTDEDPTGWATVSGWGHTVEDGELSDVMKAVTVPIVPRKVCQEAYAGNARISEDLIDTNFGEKNATIFEREFAAIFGNFTIFESMICAGEKDKDSCQHDSGGPLVQKGKKDVFTLIGIVSFGFGCGRDGFPGVYIKVASYIDWLQDNVY